MLWATVVGAHLVRVSMAIMGIDPEIVQIVAWLEKWVFISSFLSFFWRVLIRLYRSTTRPSS